MVSRRLKPLLTPPGNNGNALRVDPQMVHDVGFGRFRGSDHPVGLSDQSPIGRRHHQTMLACHPLRQDERDHIMDCGDVAPNLSEQWHPEVIKTMKDIDVLCLEPFRNVE